MFRYWRTTVPEWKAANEEIATLWRDHPEGSTQLVLKTREDGARDAHPDARRFSAAGQGRNAGRSGFSASAARQCAAEPADVRALAGGPAIADDRAVDGESVWQAYFGIGIVSDEPKIFGTQCEAPSHPELLDWLAVEFMDRGWSMKAMHQADRDVRDLSAVFECHAGVAVRATRTTGCWRAGRAIRVDAEIVRDIALGGERSVE